MAAPKNRGLGRGLEALFGDVEINTTEMVVEQKTAPKKKNEKKPAEIERTDENSIVSININNIKSHFIEHN